MKKIFNSIRAKLFITLCIVIVMIISFLVIVNSVVLETLYYYSKKETSLETFEYIKANYSEKIEDSLKKELEKISLSDTFDILIMNGEEEVFSTKGNFLGNFSDIKEVNYDVDYSIFKRTDILYSTSDITISREQDRQYGLNFIMLTGKISDTEKVYIRMPVTPIQDSVQISNQFLLMLGFASMIIGGMAILVITERFTKPIEELNDIANGMANLDFTKKYRIQDNEDEINEQFISDVSHELKTPIALIQGYAEGLVENVNTDEESKKFYSEVILDEANKMDKLVKRLLELMKLEYEERKFNDKVFDLVEVINEVIKNSKVILEEKKIDVEFTAQDPINVYADDFYIEQVVTNYFTNAMKNADEVKGKKVIKVNVKKGKTPGKLRVSVFNTGKNIADEDLSRIWNRFYKVDTSRNRSNGGTGIGLSLVKAIMNRYNNNYGVSNKIDGVEFYFEIEEAKK